MGLGTAFRHLAMLHEPDVVRMRERQAVRTAGHDGVQHSAAEKLVTFMRGEEALWTAVAEPLGRFVEDVGLFRWWWHGRLAKEPARSRLDTIVAEGQRWHVEEFTKDCIATNSLEVSEQMCALAAHLAHADGLIQMPAGDAWDFYALYDAAGARITIPAPAMRSPVPPPDRAVHSIAPPVDVAGIPVEPSRELLAPVAREGIALVVAAVPQGFRQALLTVSVDVQGGKARFFVNLVASDAAGELAAVEASQKLFEAVATMIGEQRRQGGTAWRRLVARLRATERGASIDVEVT